MPYLFHLNELKGLELILRALRSTHCIASHDLADGIEANTIYEDPTTGERFRLGDLTVDQPEPIPTPGAAPEKPPQRLRLAPVRNPHHDPAQD